MAARIEVDRIDTPSSSAPLPAPLPVLAGAGQGCATPRRLRPILSLDDFEAAARRHLPAPIFAYVSGGCENDRSLRANREAFDAYRWVTRVLTDTSRRTLATPLLGQTWAAPFGIAPMGISALSAYRGDLVQTRAAAAARIPAILSGTSLIPMEEVVRANPQAWFQAYVPGETERILRLLDRVEAAGFATLVRHGMPHFENSQATRGAPILSSTVTRDFGARDHLGWEHLALIRQRWKGHLVVKGILRPQDALAARDAGADALILSNHGGRQLDGAVPPLHMLPLVVDALGPDYPVMIDSGFRRGNDVLLALALGAHFVFVGRPFNYAGAVGGEAGVLHAIAILAAEIRRNMALIGVQRPRDLGREHLYPATALAAA
jgi:L-lactate dehydrogenase (cytochrome)